MPLYEFECETCHRQVEVQQKIADPPAVCETCKQPMKKLISRTSFQLKGTGWYATDYKKPAKAETPAADPKPAQTIKPT